MAKLAVLLAAVFGVLLVAATAHRTVVTTVEVEDEEEMNQRISGRCQQQLQSAQQLRSCQDFLREQARGGGGSSWGGRGSSQYGPEREYDPSRGSQYYPGSRGMRGQSQHLEECCDQLQRIQDHQCRCEGLSDIVSRVQGQVRGQQSQQLTQTARRLPELCGMRQTCEQIRAVYY